MIKGSVNWIIFKMVSLQESHHRLQLKQPVEVLSIQMTNQKRFLP